MSKLGANIKKEAFRKRDQLRVITKHLPILIKPLFFSIFSLYVWKYMRSHGIYFSKKSEGVVFGESVIFLITIYGIMVTITVAIIWRIYSKVVSSIFDHDKEIFLKFRDEKIPIMLHFLVGIPGLLLLHTVMKTNYEEEAVGEDTVVKISYVMGLFYIVAVELSDPKRSIWIRDRIPQEWLDADIDKIIAEKTLATKEEVTAVDKKSE